MSAGKTPLLSVAGELRPGAREESGGGAAPPPSLQLLLPGRTGCKGGGPGASPPFLKSLLIFFPGWRKNMKWMKPPEQVADGMRNPCFASSKTLL